MTPATTRRELYDALRALVPFALVSRDQDRLVRLDLFVEMLCVIERASDAQIEADGARMARAIAWAAALLPTEGGAC